MAYRIGDIYEIYLDEVTKGHFWHVADDHSQLSSQVIYVFKEKFPINSNPSLGEITHGQVDFCTHVFRIFGTKTGVWKKIGNVPFLGKVDQLFRTTQDVGNLNISVSEKWSVWRVNEDYKYVGKLLGENRNSERGDVVPPAEVITRMKTGKFSYFDHSY